MLVQYDYTCTGIYFIVFQCMTKMFKKEYYNY